MVNDRFVCVMGDSKIEGVNCLINSKKFTVESAVLCFGRLELANKNKLVVHQVVPRNC